MITIIVAAAQDGAIGKGGDLLWHLSGDLKRFKALTTGNAVIMGRKTWESLPKRPLPNRLNVVVTSYSTYDAPGAVVANSIREAIDSCGDKEIFIIGGDSIYRQTLPLADAIDFTLVKSQYSDADAFFHIPADAGWEKSCESEIMTDPKSGLSYQHITLLRKDAHCYTE